MKDRLEAWPAPSQDVGVSGAELHVWRVELDTRVCPACCEALLSAAERERAARFKFDRDRRRYIVSHAGLRSVLSIYVGERAEDLTFSAGDNGKPALVPLGGGQMVQFNLSHSHETALIAVAREEVGVDVEWIERNTPFRDIAGRFFSAGECAALDALPGDLQRLAFFKCWTAKEAFLKAKGTGLGGKLDEVEIVAGGGTGVAIEAGVAGWSFAELEPGDGYAGAVVVRGAQPQTHCYCWTGLTAVCPHKNS